MLPTTLVEKTHKAVFVRRHTLYSSAAYPGALLLTRPLSPAVTTRSHTLCSECSRSILSPLKSIPLLSDPATGYDRVSVSPNSKPERISRVPTQILYSPISSRVFPLVSGNRRYEMTALEQLVAAKRIKYLYFKSANA